MYKHILMPTDGSALSKRAVAEAIKFAQSSGARITALHVTLPYPLQGAHAAEVAAIEALQPGNYSVRSEEFAKSVLDEVGAAAAAAGLTFAAVHVSSRSVWQAIIETAKDRKCDLIFMASHGWRGLEGLLLGSETHKVLTHSNIPVLVYR